MPKSEIAECLKRMKESFIEKPKKRIKGMEKHQIFGQKFGKITPKPHRENWWTSMQTT